MIIPHARKAAAIAVVASFALNAVAIAGGSTSAGFCADAEGWNIGDTAGELNWLAKGGNGGGHIQARDLAPGVLTLYAPENFLGDLAAFNSATLAYDLRQVATNNFEHRDELGNLTIVGATGSVTIDIIPGPLPSEWDTYSIQLSAATFGMSEGDWLNFLSNVTEISLDVDSFQQFDDTVGIDNVRLGEICLGDIDGDQTVGVDDLLELLAAWGSEGGSADIDCNGIVGVDDLLTLLGAWGPC